MATTREKLLAELKKQAGIPVSGEALSRVLGISRSAVSKHVAALKSTGYDIKSTPGRGHVLCDPPDLLLPGEIRHGLTTRVFGRHRIDHHDITASTNDLAKDLAAQGADEGTLVVAEEQSAGRGRKGRSWLAPKGQGILMSLILRPHMSPSEASRITLMTAVALAETLIETTNLPVLIKWPNDILIHGKKLAGILTEMSMEMDQVDYVVVGLGLNVNTPARDFPSEIKDIASSLAAETGKTWSRSDVMRRFLVWFEDYYARVTGQGFTDVMRRWKELSDIIGRSVTVAMVGEQKINGRVRDVDDDGILILEDDEGEVHRVMSGDVLLND